MQDDGVTAIGWCFHPEGSEVGEFLAHRIAGFQRKTARRKPVNLTCANAAEIACALEDRVFLKYAGFFQFRAQAQAGIAKRFVNLDVREFVGRVEHAHVEPNTARCSVFNDMQSDCLREIKAGGEDVDPLGGIGAFPKRVAGVEPDLAVFVVA